MLTTVWRCGHITAPLCAKIYRRPTCGCSVTISLPGKLIALTPGTECGFVSVAQGRVSPKQWDRFHSLSMLVHKGSRPWWTLGIRPSWLVGFIWRRTCEGVFAAYFTRRSRGHCANTLDTQHLTTKTRKRESHGTKALKPKRRKANDNESIFNILCKVIVFI